MALRVRDVVALPDLGLLRLTGAAGWDAAVRWVAVSELVDPTPFLEGGEIVLTTGIPLREDADAAADYVGRLVSAGVAGLGVGLGLTWDAVPAAVVAAADAAGLPVFSVPEGTAFIAVTKAVSGALAAEEYEDAARGFAAQRDLIRAALAADDDGAGAVVTRVARAVGGFALHLDADGTVRHAAPAAAAARAAALAPEVARLRPRGLLAAAVVSEHGSHVVLQPLGLRGRARGFLAVGSSAPLTPTDQAVVNLAVSLLSLSLARAEGRSAAERAVRAVALRQLLDGQGSRVPVEGLGWTALGRGGVRVVLVAPVGDAGAAAEEWLAEHTPGAAVARGVLDDEPDLVVGVVAMEADLPDPEPGGPVVRAGVGEPGDARDADSLARSLLAARRALAAAPAGRTVRQDDLGAAGLEALLDPAAADAWAASLLRPLDDPGDKSDLAGTLAAWLAHHGQVDAAATELGVHRHTVRHRLRRAETLLGRPLDDAGVRAELWLALRRRR